MPRPRRRHPDPARFPPCARCGQCYPGGADTWPEGRVCKYCYLQARLRTGTCAGCGALTSLPGLNAAGQPTCPCCSGIPARFRCGCGREVTAGERGRCWWCVLAGLVTDVLAGPGGQVPARLRPLADGLVSMRRPQSGVVWLRRSATTQEALRDLARGRVPCSHVALDALGADRAVEYLRCLLVRYGVLPPRDRRLVTLCTKNEGCAASLAVALHQRPTTPGVTRSVVLVAGPDQLGFWQEAFAAGEQPGLGTVALRRLDRRAIHVWSLDTGHFTTPERQARLLEVTGGWPYLTERAVALAVEHGSEDAALTELAKELGSDDGAGELIEAVGLTQDDSLAAAFDTILAYAGAGASVSDLLEAARLADHPDPESALACLDALAVFDVDPAGLHSIEPLLVRCWPYRRPASVGDELT